MHILAKNPKNGGIPANPKKKLKKKLIKKIKLPKYCRSVKNHKKLLEIKKIKAKKLKI